jgi:hypothetical protein
MSAIRIIGGARGFSLVVTLVVTAGVGIVVGSVLCLTSIRTVLTRRVGQFDGSVGAAVAATQKVHARVTRDFQRGGDGEVNDNLSDYRSLVPLTAEALQTVLGPSSPKAPWTEYQFANVAGQINQTSVEKLSDWGFRELQTKFIGLRGYAADYRITSQTRKLNSTYPITAAVQQQVQIASIPICQYQLFYVPDLENHPSGAGMTFNGRVHCNANMYSKPEGTVTFLNHVTLARKFFDGRHPNDPVVPLSGRAVFRAERTTGVNTLNIPIGTSNTPTTLHALIDPPPLGELPNSALGLQRFYNKADLIVAISNGPVVAHSGIYNGCLVPVPWIESRGIVTTGKKLFYDKRESRDNSATEIDLAAFLANYNDFTLLLGRPVKVIWIADMRPPSWSLSYGIRIVNGRTLPAAGLTIATPNPLYIHGHFNAPNLGTTNTIGARPACLAADSTTILSSAWVDGNGPKTLSYRLADDTTVNAAIITGIVPTGGGFYSGGVENSLRSLENWTGKTLTLNGAISVLFYSTRNTAPWGSADVYSPPIRKYSYDFNLSQAAGTPPGTPEVRTILHSDWTVVRASASP